MYWWNYVTKDKYEGWDFIAMFQTLMKEIESLKASIKIVSEITTNESLHFDQEVTRLEKRIKALEDKNGV